MAYLKEIYAKMGVENDPPDSYFEADSRYLLLERTLKSVPSGNFCDLGCGRGLLIRRLQGHHESYGTDFDPGAVEYCRSQGLRAQTIDLNEASELPFPNVSFDVILISEVLEHLLAPRNAIRVAKKHLKSGGTLVVTVPNAVPLFARLKLFFGQTVNWLHYPSPETDTTGHIRFYTVESMSRLLREEGFVVETVSGVSFRTNGTFWRRMCYWPPRLLGIRDKAIGAKMDLWFAQRMPGLAAGLFFACKKP